MIVVPVLTGLLRKTQKVAHATAMLIVLPITTVTALVFVASGYFEFGIAIPVIIGTLFGGIIGAVFLKKISNKWLKYIFSMLMFIFGVRLVFR